MGKWSQREFHDVLATKVGELFQHAVDRIERQEARTSVPDKRLRTFIKDLDPNNVHIQKAFQLLVAEHLYPRAVTQRMGPPALPLPIATNMRMPIMSEQPPRQRTSLGSGGAQQTVRRSQTMSNLRRQRGAYDQVRREQRRERIVDQPIDFSWNDVIDSSPPPISLSRERITRNNPNPEEMNDFRIVDGRIEPISPPNESSNSWLEEYNQFINPQSQVERDSIRTERIHPDILPPIFQYDSDETSIPDEFDTLLDRPSSSGNDNNNSNMIIGRRRRRIDLYDESESEEQEGGLRRRTRRRIDLRREPTPMNEIRERNTTNSENYAPIPSYAPFGEITLPDVITSLPSADTGNNDEDGNNQNQINDTDRRREGVVFDSQAMTTLFEDIPTPRIRSREVTPFEVLVTRNELSTNTENQLPFDIEEYLANPSSSDNSNIES